MISFVECVVKMEKASHKWAKVRVDLCQVSLMSRHSASVGIELLLLE